MVTHRCSLSFLRQVVSAHRSGGVHDEHSRWLNAKRYRVALSPAVHCARSLHPWGKRARQNTVSIRERPAEAGDRAVTGHWEGDLLFGSNSSQIATLVERHTRYVLLVSVPSKDTRTLINALIKQANYRENPRSR